MIGPTKKQQTLHVLLVEDDEDDYLIANEVLAEITDYEVNLTWIEGYDLGLSYLAQGKVDICLVDYRIGARNGLEFVETAKARGIRCPIILLTGVGHHDIDVAATEAGAADFMEKSALSASMLERSFRYAMANARAMDALSEQTSLLETTLENSGAGIAALDASGNIVASNKLFDDLMPRIVSAYRSCGAVPMDDDGRRELLDTIDASSRGIEVEIEGNCVYEVRRNRTPYGGSVISILDISAQKSLQKNMLRAKTEAEMASRAKSSFLANVSHELRTPLNGIIGFSDLIVNQRASIDVAECATQINDSGKHLLDLINAVLDYTKLESGQHTLDEDSLYDVDLIAKFAIRQVQTQAEERGIELALHIDERLGGIRGDEMSLRRILINLLSNAVRFSNDGGKVDVSMRVDEDGSVSVSVRDEGIGMDPERVADAFIPFNQLHDSLDRQYEGTGLGLSIVQTLVQLHDGSVKIDSALGEGTTVRITLPPDRCIGNDGAGSNEPPSSLGLAS